MNTQGATGEGQAANRDGAGPLGGRGVGAAAVLLAASVLLSRVMGLVRDAVLAAQIGVGSSTDAYQAAFQIPDILNYLLAGGAMTVAVTPLYLKIRGEEGEERAFDFFRTVLGTMGAVVVVVTIGLWLYADRLMALQFDAFSAEDLALSIRLTRIVLPAQIFFITGGIVRAVLMAHGRFGAQAAVPLIYNGGIIAGGLIGGDVEGFAWGALAGAVLGAFGYPLYDMSRVGRIGARVAPWDPRFHVYLWLALPLMLGLSLTTVDEWYERYFGPRVGEGVLAALTFARRLMMAPVAVVGQAVAAAVLPTLAALHAQGLGDELNRRLREVLQGTLVLALLAAGALAALAPAIVTLAYERGAFERSDTLRVAELLAILCLAIPGWVMQQIAVRAFFSRGETWRPMLLGTALVFAVLPLYILLGDQFGARGLAAAGVAAISANALATLLWTRFRHGGPMLLPIVGSGVRTIVLLLPATIAARLVSLGESLVGAPDWRAAGLDLALGGLVYLSIATLGIHLAGDRVARETLARLQGRLRRLLGGAGGAG